MQLGYDELNIPCGEHNVNVRIYGGGDIRSAVIYIHGFGGSRDNPSARLLAQGITSSSPDAALITFDLPCHGDDISERLSLSLCDAYIDAVICYIRDKYRPERWYMCGNSFGGYLTLRRAAMRKERFERIALRCPAVEMYGLFMRRILTPEEIAALDRGEYVVSEMTCGKRVFPAFIDELRENDISTDDYAPLAEDIIIVQGTMDELVAPDSVKRFAEKNGIRLVQIEGADHRFTIGDTMSDAVDIMLSFLDI